MGWIWVIKLYRLLSKKWDGGTDWVGDTPTDCYGYQSTCSANKWLHHISLWSWWNIPKIGTPTLSFFSSFCRTIAFDGSLVQVWQTWGENFRPEMKSFLARFQPSSCSRVISDLAYFHDCPAKMGGGGGANPEKEEELDFKFVLLQVSTKSFGQENWIFWLIDDEKYRCKRAKERWLNRKDVVEAEAESTACGRWWRNLATILIELTITTVWKLISSWRLAKTHKHKYKQKMTTTTV